MLVYGACAGELRLTTRLLTITITIHMMLSVIV